MSLINNTYYKELCQTMNPYLAIMQMAKDTRDICTSLENRITTSTALAYAAQGKQPNPKDFPDHRLDRVKEYLNYVDDIEIKTAVIRSYELSLKKNNLVYEYQNVSEESRQARVRIILNMLWDKRPHKN
jgi:hypothetical protein